MRSIRSLVIASWVINLAIVGAIILLAPGVKSEMSHQTNLISWLAGVAVFFLFGSIPWFYAYKHATTLDESGGSVAIALISLGALLLLIPAFSAPPEGLGYYVIFYLVVVWLTFAIVAKRK